MRIRQVKPSWFLDIRAYGPSCRLSTVPSAEDRVVSEVVEHLVNVYGVENVTLQHRIGAGCRVDVSVVTPGERLLVECKGEIVQPCDVRQAARYRDAARRRWPNERVTVFLVGKRLSRTLPVVDGIEYAWVPLP